jgi:hypothetical protein
MQGNKRRKKKGPKFEQKTTSESAEHTGGALRGENMKSRT